MSVSDFLSLFATQKELHLVGLGETMLRITIPDDTHLEDANFAYLTAAGAESNVAIGLSKLGLRTGWIGKVGRLSIGKKILKIINAWNVDTSAVIYDDTHSGCYIWEKERRHVYYFRKIYAGAKIDYSEINFDYINKAQVFYTTGITLGLNPTTKDTAIKIAKEAKKNSIIICFDTNYREKLWPLKNICPYCESKLDNEFLESTPAYDGFIRYVDVMITSKKDLQKIWNMDGELHELFLKFHKKGVKVIVIKLEDHVALSFDKREEIIKVPTYKVPDWKIKDKVGAGDAFNVGFLYILFTQKHILKEKKLDQKELFEHALVIGNATATYGLNKRGDIESLPFLEDLKRFLKKEKEIRR